MANEDLRLIHTKIDKLTDSVHSLDVKMVRFEGQLEMTQGDVQKIGERLDSKLVVKSVPPGNPMRNVPWMAIGKGIGLMIGGALTALGISYSF
jgi:hypothetical protein